MEFYYQMYGKEEEKSEEQRRREEIEEIIRQEMALYTERNIEGGAPPISEKTLNELKIHFVTDEEVKKKEKCTICLESYSKEDQTFILPDCKHQFHVICLKEWFKKRNSCPLCRKEFQTDDTDYETGKVSKKEKDERKKNAINSMYM